ncbi:MAG TPA: hypothetical protein PKD59_12130 [Miltoncostaeaceae bacterium]|nr:hypothetical protein [Miltoncostaeaceae bacterium]
MTTDQPDQQTKCEWCGADDDPAGRPAAPAHPQPAPAPGAGAEPATHCEWCGAEYPVPEAPGASG